MKKLLLGAALGALLMPAAAFAQTVDAGLFSAQTDEHECVDDACTMVALFQSGPTGS